MREKLLTHNRQRISMLTIIDYLYLVKNKGKFVKIPHPMWSSLGKVREMVGQFFLILTAKRFVTDLLYNFRFLNTQDVRFWG